MILFVDIDGVLHPDPPQPDQRLRSLPRLVEVLRDHPQVEVVISSLWREHLSLEQLRDLFPVDLRERIIDVTPIAERIDGWLPARREGEILEWLEASGRAGESWLAIDDQKWQFTQRRDLLIACDFYDGITDAIEAELRERLAEFAAIERFLAWASAQYEIEQAIVFGSRARRDHRPDSDLDLALIMSGDRKLGRLRSMADEAYELLLETGINISPLPIRCEDWETPDRFSSPALLENIAREGVRVWKKP